MPTADRKQYKGLRIVTKHGLKTIFAPLLPIRLTAPGSPKMTLPYS